MDAIDAARAVVEEHHPDARAAFLGGSVVTGRRTATSDLDIVVLLHGAPAPYRASLRTDDWPVELFVHTEATWHSYVEREVRKRRSPLLWMCADGLLLFDTDGVGAYLAAEARKLTAAGPPMASAEEIDDCRYAITDLLDDLVGSTDQSERLFIATELVRRTGELALIIGGLGVQAESGWHAVWRPRPRRSACACTMAYVRYWWGGQSPSWPSWAM
jgi:predicted nucleotidyltransferase